MSKKYPTAPASNIDQNADATKVMQITTTHCRNFSCREFVSMNIFESPLFVSK